MYFDVSSLISSVSISIGGGDGYWCTNPHCGKFYRTQPAEGTICCNEYTQLHLNKTKLKDLIHEMGDIDDFLVQRYIEHPDEKIPEVEELFQIERERTYDGTTYDTLMDLIDTVYEDQVYDSITKICQNREFINEKRNGTTIDQISGDQLKLFHEFAPS